MMKNKALLWGGVFGLAAPFVGMFVGLQVSPMVANILMFPIVTLSVVLGQPFGAWSPMLMLAGLAVSIVFWALVFAVINTLLKRIRE
jgi:ABC-type dipeptide/oligopeptide/nickel transport system permease subunit